MVYLALIHLPLPSFSEVNSSAPPPHLPSTVLHIDYFSCGYNRTPDKKQFERGRLCFGSWFEPGRHGSGGDLQAWQQELGAAGSHLSGPGNREEGRMEPRSVPSFPVLFRSTP